MKEIEALQSEGKDSRVKIYFGHYPTSAVISTGRRDVTDLMKDGIAYLSGKDSLEECDKVYYFLKMKKRKQHKNSIKRSGAAVVTKLNLL